MSFVWGILLQFCDNMLLLIFLFCAIFVKVNTCDSARDGKRIENFILKLLVEKSKNFNKRNITKK